MQNDYSTYQSAHYMTNVFIYTVTERLREIERLINNYFKEKEPTARRKCLIQIQRRLVKSQEYGDDKLQVVGNMIDLVSG